MPQRSCPSCGVDVAAHQTLCPACRTPVPSEAGPVATSSDGSSFSFSAPPPRSAHPRTPPDLPDPSVTANRDPASVSSPGSDDEPTIATGGQVEPTVDALRLSEPTVRAPEREDGSARAHPSDTAVAAGGQGPSWAPPAGTPWTAPTGPSPDPAPDRPITTADSGEGRGGAGAPTWYQGSAPAASPSLPAGSGAGAAPSAGVLGVPGAPTLDDRGNLPGGVLGVAGAVLVAVGVALPWMDVAGESVSGWAASDDAKVLVGLAATAAAAGALVVGGARSLILRVLLGVLGLAAVALGVFELFSVSGIEDLDPSPGMGLFVGLAGGALLVAGGVLTRHRRFS